MCVTRRRRCGDPPSCTSRLFRPCPLSVIRHSHVSCQLNDLIHAGRCRRVTSRYYFLIFIRFGGFFFEGFVRHRFCRESYPFRGLLTYHGGNEYLLTARRRDNGFKHVYRVISAHFRRFRAYRNRTFVRFLLRLFVSFLATQAGYRLFHVDLVVVVNVLANGLTGDNVALCRSRVFRHVRAINRHVTGASLIHVAHYQDKYDRYL